MRGKRISLSPHPGYEAGVRGLKSIPSIEIAVEAGKWPARAELRALAAEAVAAALAVVRTEDGLRDLSPSPSPQGGGGQPRASAVPAPCPPPQAGRDEPPELSILFADDAAIRRLNAAWRGKDKATNVLAFPQASGPLMGDIILAYETVADEAALAGRPLRAHMGHLIVHGFLHLLGYDHEEDEDAEEMEALERAALAGMGIADPYAPARDE